MSEFENTGDKRTIAQQNGTKDAFTESREQSEMEAAFEKALDPIARSPAAGKIRGRNHQIYLWKIDFFGTGENDMEQRAFDQTYKRFPSCSEDWNDVTFTRQRIRCTQDTPKRAVHLKSVKAKPLMRWKKSQWNETRRKTSIALLQCTQCTDACWDR